MMTDKAIAVFRFAGQTGYVFRGGFVRWGSASFQKEAASAEMQKVINNALKGVK